MRLKFLHNEKYVSSSINSLLRRNIPREYVWFFYIDNNETKIIEKESLQIPEEKSTVNISEIKQVYSSNFWETILINRDGTILATKRKDVYLTELYFHKKRVRLYNRAKRFIGDY